MKKYTLFLCFIYIVVSSFGQTSKTFSDPEGWTNMTTGTMPLVISVPHGGLINLDSVMDRSCEGAVTVTDSYTRELANEIANMMQKYHGMKPYIIVCNLVRKDIDQNRELEEATCGHTIMNKPWQTFHDYIDTSIAMATREFGGCVYIDLHGHGHPTQRLEIGYLLKEKELEGIVKEKVNEKPLAEKSSITHLLSNRKDNLKLKDFLIGEMSFGTMMANEGIPSVPSKQDPYPYEGEKYFNGGYNTRQYTTQNYPNVTGWQIESNMKGVRDAAGRPVFAQAFCKVIVKFIKESTPYRMPVIATN